MARIILVRHGHVEGISPERFRGRRDIDLSDFGVLQARAMARRVAQHWQPAAIYSSPMKRCLQTAAPIAGRLNLSITALAELNDLDYGEWEWLTLHEARAQSPEIFARWFTAPHLVRFPGGESLQDLVARVADAFRLIQERHENETVVVVGHSSANRALLLQALGQPLSAYWRLGQDPCGVSEISISQHVITVHRLNETCLPESN
jgi:phosphoserine phosphatase